MCTCWFVISKYEKCLGETVTAAYVSLSFFYMMLCVTALVPRILTNAKSPCALLLHLVKPRVSKDWESS